MGGTCFLEPEVKKLNFKFRNEILMELSKPLESSVFYKRANIQDASSPKLEPFYIKLRTWVETFNL